MIDTTPKGLPQRIHQFSPVAHFGDGITNGMLYLRRLLKEQGCDSEIFCLHIDEQLSGTVHHVDQYPDDEDHERVLLVHHGIGCPVEHWLQHLPDLKLLVFHNITPGHLFSPNDPIQPMLEHGWAQLDTWRSWLHGAIADSDSNRSHLLARGYDPRRTITLPMLVDLETIVSQRPIAEARPLTDDFRLLFVGRLSSHKNQLGLVETLLHLRRQTGRNCSLQLVGAGDAVYQRQVQHRVREHGLNDCVEVSGKVDSRALANAYAMADLYVSLSRHEGFGMPLIEAMAHRLPVLAYQAPDSQVAQTVGNGGLVLETDDPACVATVIESLMEQPLLRRSLVKTAEMQLIHYSEDKLLKGLEDALDLAHESRANGVAGVIAPPGTRDPGDPSKITGNDSAPPPPGEKSLAPIRIEGPFESSYSLARVNRALAVALSSLGLDVQLHPTEGPGDYLVSEEQLTALPDAAPLHEGGGRVADARSVLRLMYPLRLSGMNGVNHIVSCYGWEESGIPHAVVREINTFAHVVTTMSDYVTKILLDNGVRVPVRTVGVGTDHSYGTDASQETMPKSRLAGSGAFKKKLNLLHISSGFPRKGVDTLLDAYAAAFTASDPVKLTIKTFPNPHNQIEEYLDQWQRENPDAAAVKLINRDLDDAEIQKLYDRNHVLVAPSRGEGFGLPMAEAMWHGLAVVTTGSGGALDFCNENNSWLIDYEYTRASSHLSEGLSVWAEPDKAHLAHTLKSLAEDWKSDEWLEKTGERRTNAWRQIRNQHTWSEVARRTERVLAAIDRLPIQRKPHRVGCITTWNARCGIASYSRLLLQESCHEFLIFANRNAELTAEDEPFVSRGWISGGDDDLESLASVLLSSELDDVFIQFNFSFFDLEQLGRLILTLSESGIRVWVFCHSTADVHEPDNIKSLRQIFQALASAERVLVHGIQDLNNLKQVGLSSNVAVFPHGAIAYPNFDEAPDEVVTAIEGRRVFASYGFLLPHKGIRSLIKAFSQLLNTSPDCHLLLVTAIYPDPVSDSEADACRALIAELGIESHVSLITDFLEDAKSLAYLRLADYLVFPYADTQESSSAAVRWGLAADRPVYCTPLKIFDDVADAVNFLPGTTPEQLLEGLKLALSEDGEDVTGQRRRAWLARNDWAAVTHRLDNMMFGAAAHGELSSLIDGDVSET